MLTEASIVHANELHCTSPHVPLHSAQPTHLELIMNGDRETKTRDMTPFRVYGQPGASLAVSSIYPLGAPTRGGTYVTLTGTGFHDLGDVRVRFGRLGAVQAIVHSNQSTLECITPPASVMAVRPAISLDGSKVIFSVFDFTFYDQDVRNLSSTDEMAHLYYSYRCHAYSPPCRLLHCRGKILAVGQSTVAPC